MSSAIAASLPRRFGAMLYDALLVVALWMMATFALVVVMGGAIHGALYQATLFVIAFGFLTWFWVRHGRTLGMQAWGLRVQQIDGSNITFRQAMIRIAVGIPSLLLFGAGYVWLYIDSERRTWPDLASRSVIVRCTT